MFVCKGIEIENGVFSGCEGLLDCPICEGDKLCDCGRQIEPGKPELERSGMCEACLDDAQ